MTWKSLAGGLPAGGPVHVIREDLRNRDLLFAGTEFGLFVSLDGGERWHRITSGLPTVAVHGLVIHPRDRELVIGTHGRSVYVMDIAPLEELTPKVLAGDAHLFDIKPATSFQLRRSRGLSGGKVYTAANPPFGAAIHYYLKSGVAEPVRITIQDSLGNPLAELKGPKEAGLHRVTWNLRGVISLKPLRLGPLVPPGDYVVQLQAGATTLRKKVRVETEE
jgi:hypothetical protein